MATTTNRVYEEALNLPVDDRIELIDKLLHSTNLPLQNDIDNAWINEVEKRANNFEDGNSKLIPGNEVFEKIRTRFKS